MRSLLVRLTRPHDVRHDKPLDVLARGVAAGFAATLLLSVFARLVPGMGGGRGEQKQETPKAPGDPFDAHEVREWQKRSQSPAAYRPAAKRDRPGQTRPGAGRAASVTPAGALALAEGPGPEGAAERFAVKLGSGLFNRDILPYAKPAGKAVHILYGAFWGALYSLAQASLRKSPVAAGIVHGLVVWTVGPAWLVPAMKVMRPPKEQSVLTNAMMIAGHIVYGQAVSQVFEALERDASHG